jgi:menaquinone-9 beta-reductase
VEVYWVGHERVYVTPIGGDEIGIAVLTRNPRIRLDRALLEFPLLKARVERAPAITVDRGRLTVSRRLRRVVRGKTLLIGDASGSVDAITGEGLTLAFRQAVALRDCLCGGDLNRRRADLARGCEQVRESFGALSEDGARAQGRGVRVWLIALY